jgi:hypothetical protein
MKGSGSTLGNQTYTFVGKPNNGTIASNTVGESILLTGNPYPSAIDADAFINDNIVLSNPFQVHLDGTLYFWNITQQITIYFVITKGICSTKLTGGITGISRYRFY